MRDALAEQIRESALVEHSNALISVIDPDGTITYQSPSARHIVGLDPDTIEGENIFELTHHDDDEAVTDAVQHAVEEPETEQRFQFRVQNAAGEWRFFQGVCENFLDDPFVEGLIISSRDITDIIRRERQLEELNTRLELALDETDTGVWEWQLDTDKVVWDEASERLFGYDPGEFPETFEGFANRVPDADLETVQQEIDATLDTGEEYRADFRVVPPSGNQRWVQARGIVQFDEDGGADRLIGIQTDITERKEREQELEETKTELEQSNEKLEQFAYVASHDLQEPLRMVSSYMELLELELGEELDEETREYIEFAADGADRMQAMIDGLLEYSRVQTDGDPFETVDSDAVLDETLQDLELKIADSGAEITRDTLPTVTADSNQLGQVFQNLIKNAIEHGNENMIVEVTASERDGATEFAVADNGPGIPDHRQEDIFSIFDKGGDSEGTGIGLAVCQQVVERHGGEIWVESTEGEGTTFYFTIAAKPDQ